MRTVTWGVLLMACKLVTNLLDTGVWVFHLDLELKSSDRFVQSVKLK
jgi:hypothetical protein